MPPQTRTPGGLPPPRIGRSYSLSGLRVLVVDPTPALPQVLGAATAATVSMTTLPNMTAALLERLRPDVVLSPLFSSDHDVLDLARQLDRLGYRGALRAYCLPLPNVALVRAEVEQVWSGSDFDIFELPLNLH